MDSYQNLLFSIARFFEFTGHYPSKITVVGYEFKRARFTKLHRKAIRWPVESFNYVGVDPEHDGGSNAVEGEVSLYLIDFDHIHLNALTPAIAPEWISSLYLGYLWVPLHTSQETPTKKSLYEIPSILFIYTTIGVIIQLVSRGC